MVRDFVRGRPPYRARSGAGHRASARRRPTGRPDLRPASTPPLSRTNPPHGSASAEASVRVTAPGTGDGDGGVGGGLPARHGPSRNGEAVPRRHALPGQVEPFLGSSRKCALPEEARPSSKRPLEEADPSRRGGQSEGGTIPEKDCWLGRELRSSWGQLTHAGEAVCSAPPGGVLGDDQDTRCPSGRGPAKPRPRYLASGDPRPPRSHALRGRVAPARLAPCRALSPYSPQSSARVRTGPGSR